LLSGANIQAPPSSSGADGRRARQVNGALPCPRQAAGRAAVLAVVTITFALGEAISVVRELFEWGLDAVAATNLSKGYIDTLVDLTMESGGALAGGGALLLWARWARAVGRASRSARRQSAAR
jgi:hypothetical protein